MATKKNGNQKSRPSFRAKPKAQKRGNWKSRR